MEERKLVRSSILDKDLSNSQTKPDIKDKEERKIQPVVKKGSVTVVEPTKWDKIKEAFIGESKDLGDFMIYDVLIPALRNTISDLGIGIIEQLFGGNGRSSNISRNRGRSYVSYNNYSRSSRDDRRDIDRRDRAIHDFSNIIFMSRSEAESVLENMCDMVYEYGDVTVRTFYELSGIESSYTDDQYGWRSLRDAYVERSRNGYCIKFPPPRYLQ